MKLRFINQKWCKEIDMVTGMDAAIVVVAGFASYVHFFTHPPPFEHDEENIIFVTKLLGLSCFIIISISFVLWHCSTYIFDETRSAKNRPHDHLYTRIDGIWYDFKSFDHPGGPIALNLAKDRDATALFHSHHLMTSTIKMEKIISKYKVKEEVARTLHTMGPRDDGAHFVWGKDSFHDDEFVRDLKLLVRSYFSAIVKRQCHDDDSDGDKTSSRTLYRATKATPSKLILIGVLAIAFLLTVPFLVRGRIWALFVTPQLAWMLVANYTHDAMHFSLHRDWRVNAIVPYLFPILSSPLLWRIDHTVGHHCYTNVAYKDPDIAHAPQFKREHRSISWKKTHEHQGTLLRFALLWSVSVGLGLNVIGDLKTNMKLTLNNAVAFPRLSWPRWIAHMLGRVFYIFVIFLWPFFRFDAWKAIIWSTVPIAIFGCSFMLNSQVNHLTVKCSNASDPNFLKHQVITAQNFGCGSRLHLIFSGGLNYQIEHHLFPFINHCHLPKLAPGVKKICQKHGVRYNEVGGYIEALRCHLEHTDKLSKRS